MKYAALAAMFCIGLFAWYHYPDPSPPAKVAPPAKQQHRLTRTEPQRVAAEQQPCASFQGTVEWQQLQAIYQGMNDAALCDFVLAPDLAKLDGVNVNPQEVDKLLNGLFDQHDDESSHLVQVPDLRYYLDPQAIEAMRGLTEHQLIAKVNNERSPEAAFLLAQKYQEDEQTYVMLMLSAASYAQKPGPLLNAINGCCSWTPDDIEAERAAAIKREALILIAREMELPEASDWPEFGLDPAIEAEVLAQRAAYVEELNQYSMEAFGEEWIK